MRVRTPSIVCEWNPVGILRSAALAILFFIALTSAKADGTGTVAGAVTDPTGAMIPGALISFESVGSAWTSRPPPRATRTGNTRFRMFLSDRLR
jgi:hypothetical protein